jgi:hypothetical protein
LYRNEWGGEFLGKEENQEDARDEDCKFVMTYEQGTQSMVPLIKWKKTNSGFYVVITSLEDWLGKGSGYGDVLFFFFKK